MSSDWPRRGDLVAYEGEVYCPGHLYYYQQNGPGCHLYRHREDIGVPNHARVTLINHLLVRRPTLAELEAHARFQAIVAEKAPRDEKREDVPLDHSSHA